jgi:hypothetical protein
VALPMKHSVRPSNNASSISTDLENATRVEGQGCRDPSRARTPHVTGDGVVNNPGHWANFAVALAGVAAVLAETHGPQGDWLPPFPARGCVD